MERDVAQLFLARFPEIWEDFKQTEQFVCGGIDKTLDKLEKPEQIQELVEEKGCHKEDVREKLVDAYIENLRRKMRGRQKFGEQGEFAQEVELLIEHAARKANIPERLARRRIFEQTKRVLQALESLGKRTRERLLQRYDLEEIPKLRPDEVKEIKGIGEKKTNRFFEQLK